jgi:hypothetical protein
MSKIINSENTNKNNCVKKCTFNKKWSEEIMQCRPRREPWKRRTLFKENDNFDVEIIIVAIMKLRLFNSFESWWQTPKMYMQIYIFMKQQEAT